MHLHTGSILWTGLVSTNFDEFRNTSRQYINADLKISLYDCVYIKQYFENFAFLILILFSSYLPM